MLKFFTLIFILFSCDSNVIDPNNTGSGDKLSSFNVKLRIKNLTNQNINNASSNGKDFGQIKSTKTSDYKGFNTIKQFPYSTFSIDGIIYTNGTPSQLDPIYEIGWYTISITAINQTNQTFTASIVKDK